MERKYWLHRISNAYQLSYVFLTKRNLLSIGFADFSNVRLLNRIIDEPKEIDVVFEEIWGEVSRSRFCLSRFVCEMKKGDYVIVPRSGVFDIYEIIGEKPITNDNLELNGVKDLWNNEIYYGDLEGQGSYLYYISNEKKQLLDLGFYWEVKPIALDISRYDYADQFLTSRMKIRQTNANVDDIKDSIETALARFKSNQPINIHNTIIQDNSDEILESIHTNLDADKFEGLVKWYMERIGADYVEIPSKNSSSTEEGDADVVAYFEKIKVVVLIQVKKHISQTDDWAVEQIKLFEENNVNDEYTVVKWVVSTCDTFSLEAIEKANSNHVRLINGLEFVKMILNCGLQGLDL